MRPDSRDSVPMKTRDIYIPDLRYDSLKVKSRNFQKAAAPTVLRRVRSATERSVSRHFSAAVIRLANRAPANAACVLDVAIALVSYVRSS